MGKRLALGEAEAEAAEVRSWSCTSCRVMIEDHQPGPFCRSCADYFADPRNIFFDELDPEWWGD